MESSITQVYIVPYKMCVPFPHGTDIDTYNAVLGGIVFWGAVFVCGFQCYFVFEVGT